MMYFKFLYENPKRLDHHSLKLAILLGCSMLFPLWVLGLIKGFYTTSSHTDIICFGLHVYGWIRVIWCETYRMYDSK